MYKHERKFKKRSSGGHNAGLGKLFCLLLGGLLGAFLFAPGRGGEARPGESAPAPLPLVPESAALASSGPAANSEEPPAEGSQTETPAEGDMQTIELDSPVVTVSIEGKSAEMELEEYLVGVVAGEMPASSEPAALAAQAVAARTFTALHMAGRAKCGTGCTVCDRASCCQAYLADDALRERWGEAYEENIMKIRSAVACTRGLVSVYEGQLISALYHASSGPATESSEEVFACALPYLVSVESCEGDHEVVTRQEFSAEEVVERLNGLYPEANMKLPLGELDFDIWGRTDSGRVRLIRIGDTVIPGGYLRMALGLKSTAFEVEKTGETVVFTCFGYGHGVGMSQTGANEMARSGSSFEQILKHFYTGTELARLSFKGEKGGA